jgi:diguanylate cyclase (GGDEF)-like protein
MFFKSFRARLSWFFVVIVILPIVMVTAVLFRLVADSEQGKSDARLAQAQTSASDLYRTTELRAESAAQEIAASAPLARALAPGAPEAALATALAAAVASAHAQGATLTLPSGRTVGVPPTPAVATAEVTLSGTAGPAGRLRVAVTRPQELVRSLHDLTGLDVAISGADGPLAATTDSLPRDLPTRGSVDVGGRGFRVAGFTAGGAGGVTISLLADKSETDGNTNEDRLVVIALLLAFVLLAFLFAAAVSRSLQAQIGRLLQGARRLGRGELDAEVPTEGDDEFAALGSEFNAMARQLRVRLDELESERERLQNAIRRVGASIATGSDRNAVLDIVVQTAADGVGAAAGRASVRPAPGGPLEHRAAVGDTAALAQVLDAAEDDVLETRQSSEVSRGDAHALAHPLRPTDGTSAKVVGLVSVARTGRPFTTADKDLFHYLAGQASVSIENVDLHENVQRQAVTDGLTGLFNHRRFQEVMALEVERSKRFNHPLGLVMLDLDDFKDVNDRWGHLQGDQVLREVARVVLDTSREIDEPARYGGEEMAVVLPQTDLDGAFEFAERLRDRIESLTVPVLNGTGEVHVTASIGAAALPESAIADKDALVQAADSALYRAKRLGKNRVMKAG